MLLLNHVHVGIFFLHKNPVLNRIFSVNDNTEVNDTSRAIRTNVFQTNRIRKMSAKIISFSHYKITSQMNCREKYLPHTASHSSFVSGRSKFSLQWVMPPSENTGRQDLNGE